MKVMNELQSRTGDITDFMDGRTVKEAASLARKQSETRQAEAEAYKKNVPELVKPEVVTTATPLETPGVPSDIVEAAASAKLQSEEAKKPNVMDRIFDARYRARVRRIERAKETLTQAPQILAEARDRSSREIAAAVERHAERTKPIIDRVEKAATPEQARNIETRNKAIFDQGADEIIKAERILKNARAKINRAATTLGLKDEINARDIMGMIKTHDAVDNLRKSAPPIPTLESNLAAEPTSGKAGGAEATAAEPHDVAQTPDQVEVDRVAAENATADVAQAAETETQTALAEESETPPMPISGSEAAILGETTAILEVAPVATAPTPEPGFRERLRTAAESSDNPEERGKAIVGVIAAEAGERLEDAKNAARNLRDRLVNNFERYKEHPGEILKDGKNLLEFGVKAWWNGIKPIDFYDPDPDKRYLARYKWKNVLVYLGGAAIGAAVDITALFPGMGGLRPAARLGLSAALGVAMGWSETRERRQIEKLSGDENEKAARLLDLEERHKKASTFATELAHGMAAGMLIGGIVQAFGIDKAGQDFVNKLFKPTPEEAPRIVMPTAEQPIALHEAAQPGVEAAAPKPEVPEISLKPPVSDIGVTEAAPQNIIFKVPEAGADSLRGFWGADVSALGEAAHNWGISAAEGSDKTAILGLILRANAGQFGIPGDTIGLSQFGENSLKLIKLLGESKTQADFLANGGRNLINLVNAGQL